MMAGNLSNGLWLENPVTAAQHLLFVKHKNSVELEDVARYAKLCLRNLKSVAATVGKASVMQGTCVIVKRKNVGQM